MREEEQSTTPIRQDTSVIDRLALFSTKSGGNANPFSQALPAEFDYRIDNGSNFKFESKTAFGATGQFSIVMSWSAVSGVGVDHYEIWVKGLGTVTEEPQKLGEWRDSPANFIISTNPTAVTFYLVTFYKTGLRTTIPQSPTVALLSI